MNQYKSTWAGSEKRGMSVLFPVEVVELTVVLVT